MLQLGTCGMFCPPGGVESCEWPAASLAARADVLAECTALRTTHRRPTTVQD